MCESRVLAVDEGADGGVVDGADVWGVSKPRWRGVGVAWLLGWRVGRLDGGGGVIQWRLALRQVQKTLRREHTEQVRDLETTIRAYANQIRTLALRNDELTDENTRLRHHLEQQDTNVTKLPQRD
ncbi:MAG: hypothetical protein WCF33_16195 [Pseudonocardiaceae bacterium]